MRKVFVLFLAAAVFVGAGCSKPAPTADPNDPNALNMPGVPYGTYQKAQKDIDAAKQAEQQWSGGTR